MNWPLELESGTIHLGLFYHRIRRIHAWTHSSYHKVGWECVEDMFLHIPLTSRRHHSCCIWHHRPRSTPLDEVRRNYAQDQPYSMEVGQDPWSWPPNNTLYSHSGYLRSRRTKKDCRRINFSQKKPPSRHRAGRFLLLFLRFNRFNM